MMGLAIITVLVWLGALATAWAALRSGGPIRRLRRLLEAAGLALLGTLLAAILAVTHAFHAFAGQALVASVTVVRLAPEQFELTYETADGQREQFIIHGDQWAISGGIVKWHPWLTAAGLKSYHKPMRLSGQFSRIERQRAQSPTAHALEPGTDRVWEALYWAGPHLPFVEAVYGSSAYVYAEPRTIQYIYVTPSGYMIKKDQPS